MSLLDTLWKRLLLVTKHDLLVTSSRPMAPTQGCIGNDLRPSMLLLIEASRCMHAIDRLVMTRAGARCRSCRRRGSHLHIVTVRCAQFRCMLVQLLTYPVLLVIEIVYSVQERWLLAVWIWLFRVRTVQIERFGFLISDGVRPRIIERVVPSQIVVVV